MKSHEPTDNLQIPNEPEQGRTIDSSSANSAVRTAARSDLRRRTDALRLAGVLLVLAIAVPAAAAETYKIDASHSAVLFRVKHLNVANFYGRFNGISGTIKFDESDPSKSSIEVTVETESIDSGNEKGDGHLKSTDFFNARQFPQMTFKSTSVKAGQNDSYMFSGELTLHGVTKPIEVTLERTGSGPDPWGGYRTGLETTFSIKRSDFGMDHMLKALGDDIRLIVSLEAVRE